MAGRKLKIEVVLGLATTPLSTVRTDYTPKIRFAATLGKEPEVEVVLV